MESGCPPARELESPATPPSRRDTSAGLEQGSTSGRGCGASRGLGRSVSARRVSSTPRREATDRLDLTHVPFPSVSPLPASPLPASPLPSLVEELLSALCAVLVNSSILLTALVRSVSLIERGGNEEARARVPTWSVISSAFFVYLLRCCTGELVPCTARRGSSGVGAATDEGTELKRCESGDEPIELARLWQDMLGESWCRGSAPSWLRSCASSLAVTRHASAWRFASLT